MPAIVTGVMLAIARAAGETAPVLFTSLFNQYWNRTLWEPTATMSMLVYNFATVPYKNQQELAWAGALVLVFLVLITSILARWAIKRR
jgi:phosphate transport system permease protein